MASKIVLASQSPYKRQLLSRLVGDVATDPSGVDESPLAGENPRDQAVRLAEAKAREVAPRQAGAWVIGADQLAELDGRAVGKQPTIAQARSMLLSLSGRALNFHTAVCVLDPQGEARSQTDLTVARFRTLDPALVERYLALDAPYDCTAAFRAEGAGPLLLEALETADPTAIVGPAIDLAGIRPAARRLLKNRGVGATVPPGSGRRMNPSMGLGGDSCRRRSRNRGAQSRRTAVRRTTGRFNPAGGRDGSRRR